MPSPSGIRPAGTTARQRPAAGGRITASGWACLEPPPAHHRVLRAAADHAQGRPVRPGHSVPPRAQSARIARFSASGVSPVKVRASASLLVAVHVPPSNPTS